MNIDTITPADLHPIMEFCRSEKLSLMILGEPGCGKSEMVSNYAMTRCMPGVERRDKLIDLRLTTIQSPDIGGMFIPDLERGQTLRLPPEFLPGEDDERTEGVLFLDEIDRAAPDIQASAMPLLLERRVAGRYLPDGWLVCAAGNGLEFSDHTYEFDPAIADRLVMVRMMADLKSTLDFGIRTGRLADKVISYLRAYPDDLSHGEKRRQNNDLVAPSPRGWERVSKVLLKENSGLSVNQRQAIIAGIIGREVAARFFLYLEEIDQFTAVDQLFEEEDRQKRIKMLPEKEIGIYHLSYGLARLIKDLKTAERALEIINDFDTIAERNPEVPVSDIKTMAAELCFEKISDTLKLTNFTKTKAWAEYKAWRERVLDQG